MFLLNLLILMITYKCACYEVPVLLIDNKRALESVNITTKALYKLKRSEFSEILHETIRKSDTIIIFTEDYLSVEDIASKDSLGSLYPNLQKSIHDKKVIYMPAVEEPYTVLQQIFQPTPQNIYNISLCNLYKDLERMNTGASYIYINLIQLSNETRTEALRNHDFIMKEILASYGMKNSVVAFYTGKKNPILKMAKHSKPQSRPRISNIMMGADEVFVTSSEMLYYLSGIHYKSSLRTMQIEIPYNAIEKWETDNLLRTSMTFSNFEIKFDFIFGPSYWRIDKVHLLEGGEEVGSVRMGVGAPTGYSFYCFDPIVLVNSRDGSHVTIQKYQILPRTTTLSTRRWDRSFHSTPKVITRHDTDAYLLFRALENCQKTNCGQYFQDVTLAVLLVVFILLFIFFSGITAIMNLKTNDKYDDPHGKQLHLTTEL